MSVYAPRGTRGQNRVKAMGRHKMECEIMGTTSNVVCAKQIYPKFRTSCVRGALLAKGPDSSLGEVHRGSCSGNIHMEEEKVEVKRSGE